MIRPLIVSPAVIESSIPLTDPPSMISIVLVAESLSLPISSYASTLNVGPVNPPSPMRKSPSGRVTSPIRVAPLESVTRTK